SAARRILGLSAVPGTQVPALSALDPTGGLGLVTGYGATVIDSALACAAESVSGTSPPPGRTSFVLSAQNPDGGWPFAGGGPSRVEPTMRALHCLSVSVATPAIQGAVGRAVSFLQSRGQGGSIADDLPAPATEALGVLALIEWNALSPASAIPHANYLLGTQGADASWGGSAYQTAMVLRAIRTIFAPNLSLDGGLIARDNSVVTDGETVGARVQVQNTGVGVLDSIVVRAFDSAGVPMGETVIPHLAPARTAMAVLSLATFGHAGSTQAFFVVDPDGAIDEVRKDDNRAV